MLTHEDMTHLSSLARLAPDKATLEKFSAQCDDILQYMNVLTEVDTTGVEALYSPVRHTASTRPDVPAKRRQREEILANAPETDGRFFVVPRIV